MPPANIKTTRRKASDNFVQYITTNKSRREHSNAANALPEFPDPRVSLRSPESFKSSREIHLVGRDNPPSIKHHRSISIPTPACVTSMYRLSVSRPCLQMSLNRSLEPRSKNSRVTSAVTGTIDVRSPRFQRSFVDGIHGSPRRFASHARFESSRKFRFRTIPSRGSRVSRLHVNTHLSRTFGNPSIDSSDDDRSEGRER